MAPGGEAVGIDASAAMLEVARQRLEGTGLAASFHVGDAMALDLPTDSFDAVRCERLLIHVPDAAVVLDEMVRVTRPGGRIVVIDIDFDLMALDLPGLDPAFVRRAVHAMCDAMSVGPDRPPAPPPLPGGQAGGGEPTGPPSWRSPTSS